MFQTVCKFLTWSFVIFLTVYCININCGQAGGPPPIKFDDTSEDIIYYVPQFTDFQEVSIHELRFLKEVLKEAEEKNIKAVIFEIDTPGGRVDYAYKYMSILDKAEVPTIAFVNNKGISAGMLIAMAADRIAISPNGTIGDAMPLQFSVDGMRPLVDKREDEKTKKTEEKDKKAEPKSKDKKTAKAPAKEEKEAKTKEKEDGKADKGTKAESKDKKKDEETDKAKDKAKDDAIKRLEDLVKKLDKLKKKPQITPENKKLLDQKQLTVFFKTLQVLAEKNNRPVRVIRAMADPYQKLSEKEDGFEHTKVSPLTLSAVEAKRLHVVDYISRNNKELKKQLGLENCKIVTKNKTPTHFILYFLAYPLVSVLLIIIGLVGLYIEAKTPGFGFAGGLGLVALILFFIGHIGIGHSNWIPSAIFLLGIILLALEIFVIPGFGITGISGIIAIFVSLLLAFGWDNIEMAINYVGLAIIIATVLIIVLTIYVLPKSTVFKKITLSTSHSNKAGFSSHDKPNKTLIGQEGIVHTTLRPTGLAIIDEKRLDVMTEGDFIEKGEKIKVTRVEGMRIVVEKV